MHVLFLNGLLKFFYILICWWCGIKAGNDSIDFYFYSSNNQIGNGEHHATSQTHRHQEDSLISLVQGHPKFWEDICRDLNPDRDVLEESVLRPTLWQVVNPLSYIQDWHMPALSLRSTRFLPLIPTRGLGLCSRILPGSYPQCRLPQQQLTFSIWHKWSRQ